MKLETVSKIKGTVALVCLLYVIGGAFVLDQRGMRGPFGPFAGLALVVGCIYLIKWMRLRRFMRRAQYAARIGAPPRY